MSTATTTALRTPAGEPLELDLTAVSAEVYITTDALAAEATSHISGPREVTDRATARRDGNRWVITVPEPPGSSGAGVFAARGGGRVVRAQNVSATSIVMSGGDVTINGMRTSGQTPIEDPVRVTVVLPEQSQVRVGLENGSVRTNSPLDQVGVRADNASITIDQAVRVQAESSNGSVTINAARETIDATTTNGNVTLPRTAPRTRARTTNGSITAVVSGPHQVEARTTNGDVMVLCSGHRADVDASTVNGRRTVHQ